jgi:hypothetical protein
MLWGTKPESGRVADSVMIRFAPVPRGGKLLFILGAALRFRLRKPRPFSTFNPT